MRTHKHHRKTDVNRRNRRTHERVSLMKERSRKEQEERDARVTAEYGERGHKSCGRKVRYATKSLALIRAQGYIQKGAPALRPYRCPYCGGWHLTKDFRS